MENDKKETVPNPGEVLRDGEPPIPEYDPERTVLEFDAGDWVVGIWIDGYYQDDPPEDEPVDRDLEEYPEEIRRNAVKCGRYVEAKEGAEGAWMCWHEFVLASDIEELRRLFESLKSRKIDSFGPFPERGADGFKPLFSFSAGRKPDGAWIFLELHVPGSGDDEFDLTVSEEKLAETCEYFRWINAWFPPVGPGEKQILRWRMPPEGG